MADILRIAKERRGALAAEIAKLDEFIRMAGVLEQGRQSQIPALPSPAAKTALPETGLPAVAGEMVCATPMRTDTNLDKQAAVEAPRLLLPYHADVAGPAERAVGVTGALTVGFARPPRAWSTFCDFIEALRNGIQQHYGASQNSLALVEVDWLQRILLFGKAALAACRPRETETLATTRRTAFLVALREGIRRHFGSARNTPALGSSASAQPLLRDLADKAALARPSRRDTARVKAAPSSVSKPVSEWSSDTPARARTVVPTQAQAGSMTRMAGALEQLGTREKSAARSIDIHLGQKVRQRRWMLGVSRQRLAQRLGVTRAQIENYETGAEQVDVTGLYKIAAALEVPAAFFFEGLDVQAPDAADARAELLSDEEALQQLEAFSEDTFIFYSSRSA